MSFVARHAMPHTERLVAAGRVSLVAALALLAGLLVAGESRFALVLAFAPVGWLLLTSPLARLVVVSFGALLTFQSSSEVSWLKSAYLLCFLVSVTGAVMSLSRDRSIAPGPTRTVAWAAAVILGLVVVSIGPAFAYGTPPIDWLRDGFSYLFFGGSVLLAIDYARHISARTLTVVLLSCGALATASFFVAWIDRRHTAEIGFTRLGFSSFLLSVALIAFAVAKTQWPGAHRFRWSAVAAVLTLGLFATATRSSLVLLVPLFVVVALAPTPLGSRVLGISALVTVTLGLGIFAVRGGIASDIIDLERTSARLATVTSALADPTSDPSLLGRRIQTRAAMRLFESAPIMGVGPGHPITVSGLPATKGGYFVDSPAGFLAKFGVVGLIGLAAFLSLIGHFLMATKAWRSPAGLGLVAFLATATVWSVLGTPFDDRGTALGLGLLLALTIQETHALERRPA